MFPIHRLVAQDPAPGAGFDLADLSIGLLGGAVIVIIAVAAVRWSVRSGLPTLLLYLGIGLALGSSGLGVKWDNTQLTMVLGYAALVLILIEGGLTTSWSSLRPAVAPAAVLSTVGVLVSVAVVAVAGHLILGWPWQQAALVGAILSSTDAAAVFSVLRKVPLPGSVTGVLEAESGFNDAPVVILVTTLALALSPGRVTPVWWLLALKAILELAGGALVGLAVGWLGGRLLPRIATGSSTLFAIGVMATAVLAYAAADEVHASGFIACYLASVVLANSGLPHRPAVVGFSTALGWLAQIGLFVLLGLLASPPGFPAQLVPALVIGGVLLLLARPLSVLASVLPFRVPLRAQAFMSWAGLRGAVPIVLATVPLNVRTPGVPWIFDLVFVLVVVFTLIQAPTLPWVARYLGLRSEHHQLDLVVDATPLEELGADMLQVTVGPESRLGGVTIGELRLPASANIALIVRDKTSVVPGERTRLRHGDQLIIICPAKVREATEKRLYRVSQEGRLAGWIRTSQPPVGRNEPRRPPNEPRRIL